MPTVLLYFFKLFHSWLVSKLVLWITSTDPLQALIYKRIIVEKNKVFRPGARVDLISQRQLSRSGHSSSSKPSPRFLTWWWRFKCNIAVSLSSWKCSPTRFCHRHQGLAWEPISHQAGSRGSGGTCWKDILIWWSVVKGGIAVISMVKVQQHTFAGNQSTCTPSSHHSPCKLECPCRQSGTG